MNALSISDGGVKGSVRNWLRLEGLAVLTLSVLLYWHSRAGWWLFFGLLLTPDLSMLLYLVNPKIGGLCYNVVHSYLLPLGLAVIAIAADKAVIGIARLSVESSGSQIIHFTTPFYA